jgi:NADP-dependent 3-hydroxy acid dehydrogenase YdfG
VVTGARRVERLEAVAEEDRRVVFAMSQPDDVDVNEILFRPTKQQL